MIYCKGTNSHLISFYCWCLDKVNLQKGFAGWWSAISEHSRLTHVFFPQQIQLIYVIQLAYIGSTIIVSWWTNILQIYFKKGLISISTWRSAI